jgi:hypothetical protein
MMKKILEIVPHAYTMIHLLVNASNELIERFDYLEGEMVKLNKRLEELEGAGEKKPVAIRRGRPRKNNNPD